MSDNYIMGNFILESCWEILCCSKIPVSHHWLKLVSTLCVYVDELSSAPSFLALCRRPLCWQSNISHSQTPMRHVASLCSRTHCPQIKIQCCITDFKGIHLIKQIFHSTLNPKQQMIHTNTASCTAQPTSNTLLLACATHCQITHCYSPSPF